MKKTILSLIICFLALYVLVDWFGSLPKELSLDIYYPKDNKRYGRLLIKPLEKKISLVSSEPIHCSIKIIRDEFYGKTVRETDEHYKNFAIYNKNGSTLGRVNGLLWPNFTSTEYIPRSIWKNPYKAAPILRY